MTNLNAAKNWPPESASPCFKGKKRLIIYKTLNGNTLSEIFTHSVNCGYRNIGISPSQPCSSLSHTDCDLFIKLVLVQGAITASKVTDVGCVE